MLVIIPRRCSPPQPQISDSIDLPLLEDRLSRWATVGVDDFFVPHAHPQLLPVAGPQQQPGRVDIERSITQQPAVSDPCPVVGRGLMGIPGRTDCPTRHTNTRPQIADDCHRCLEVECEWNREVITGNSKQLAGETWRELLVRGRIRDD